MLCLKIKFVSNHVTTNIITLFLTLCLIIADKTLLLTIVHYMEKAEKLAETAPNIQN